MRASAAILLAASLLWPAPPARGLELGHHDIPATARVGERTLVLNGAGIRRKFFVHVYVCALYLEEPSTDAAAILAADRAWQVTMHFMRNITHHQVLESFTDAFEHNSPGQTRALHDDLERFHAVLEDVRQGQDLTIHYQPGVGTTLLAPSGARATVPGRPFAEAMLRTWLGEHPSDESLKEKMLGQ
jgi:hypothetical protein